MEINSLLSAIQGPTRVVFEPTINCNLRCPMCDRTHKSDYKKHKDEHMPTEMALEFLKSLGTMGVKHILLIGGGEPLMHPAINQFIEIIKSSNIYLHLWTNGSLITESNAGFLAKNCDMITVSLDSPHPEVNDILRGVPGCTEKTINGLKLLRKENKESYLRIHSVLSAKNIPHLTDFIPLINEIKLNEVGGAMVNPFEFVPSDFLITEEKKPIFALKINEFCELLRKKGIALAGCYNPISKNKIEEIKKQLPPIINTDPHITCLGLWSQATVRPNGDVSVCCFSYKPVLGNLHDMTFSEIWKSQKANTLRKTVAKGVLLDKPCAGCDLGNQVFTKLLERDGNLDAFNDMLVSSR